MARSRVPRVVLLASALLLEGCGERPTSSLTVPAEPAGVKRPAANVVSGRVVDYRGDGVLARVWWRPERAADLVGSDDTDAAGSVVTADDGSFTIPVTPRGPVRLQATEADAEGPEGSGFTPWTIGRPGDPPVVLKRQRTTDAALHPGDFTYEPDDLDEELPDVQEKSR